MNLLGSRPKRPLPLRLLPLKIQQSVFARCYRSRAARWPHLYALATLRFAPRFSMTNLVPGDIVSDYIAFTGTYEASLSCHVARLARSGGLMIDVGANMGYYSLLWASGNPENRVVAIEASPRNITHLRHNIEANGLTNRIQVVFKAAGKAEGTFPFALGNANQTGWGGLASSPTPETIDVEVERIDQLITRTEDIALMKIDAEGADTWVLVGSEGLLRARRIKEIWFEQNKPQMRELGIAEEEARRFLSSCGYRAEPRSNPKTDNVEWCAVPL